MSKITMQNPNTDLTSVERDVENLTETAQASADANKDAVRESFQEARSTAENAASELQEKARASVADTTNVLRDVADILEEQTRHGMETANTLGRLDNWTEFAKAQTDFIGASFARIYRINDCYRDLFLKRALAFPTRN